jgi:hypothetical protein
MNILGRNLDSVDISPFREQETFRVDVHRRDEKEYCPRGRFSKPEYFCGGDCRELFMSAELYRRDNEILFDPDATTFVVPPVEYIDPAMSWARGIRTFEQLGEFFRSNYRKLMNVELKIVVGSGDTLYTVDGVSVGRKRDKCGMLPYVPFLSSMPPNLQPFSPGLLKEADSTCFGIDVNKMHMYHQKRDMTYQEMLGEGVRIVSEDLELGWDFLCSRPDIFDRNFLLDVKQRVERRAH